MLIYIFGKNTVREAVMLNKTKHVFIANSLKDAQFIALLKNKGVRIEYKDDGYLSTLVKGNHQGIVAEVERYEYSSLEEIIHFAKKETNPIILLLDEIKDPGNFGAILRSCDAFSVSGVIIKKHGQVMLNETVAKTSTGAINHVRVAQVSNLSQAIETLKQEGYWVVSSDGSAKINISDMKYNFPVALIVGSEGDGISQLLLKRSDYIVKIPMTGHVNSLNASVATGIFLSFIRSLQ